jgi:hypothetical protein
VIITSTRPGQHFHAVIFFRSARSRNSQIEFSAVPAVDNAALHVGGRREEEAAAGRSGGDGLVRVVVIVGFFQRRQVNGCPKMGFAYTYLYTFLLLYWLLFYY